MNAPYASSLPPPRPWAQFSLKTLMLLMLLAAAFFGGWAVAWRKAQEFEMLARQEAEMARASEMQARALAEMRTAQQQLLVAQAQQLKRASATSPPPAAAEIEAVLRLQAEAWNTGDIERFMEHYWKSEELTFSSGGQTTRGWQNTLDRYKERYPTTEKMGRLSFDQLDVRPLGETAALVLGRWQLVRDGDMPGGNFSLIVQQIDSRWVIVHDHTSRTPPTVEPPAPPP